MIDGLECRAAGGITFPTRGLDDPEKYSRENTSTSVNISGNGLQNQTKIEALFIICEDVLLQR